MIFIILIIVVLFGLIIYLNYNNFVDIQKGSCILGCFQLYKKHVYHRENFENAGWGDYYFGWDNFNLFCSLSNIIYFHLGQGGLNWNGKVISFIDNINISLNDIYYTIYNKKNIKKYYNNKFKLINI